MRNFKKKKKEHTPPGTLAYTGDRTSEEVEISQITYSEETFKREFRKDVEDISLGKDKEVNTWVDICGIHDVEIVKHLGDDLGIHSLLQEDIVTANQRPKLEEREDYLFIILNMHYIEDENPVSEQLSIILGENYLTTFRERKNYIFQPVISRMEKGDGRIRKLNTDYLAYALIDVVVDNYFKVLEHFGGKMENVEETLVDDPEEDLLLQIHRMKQEIILLRKSIWPLREVLGKLERGGYDLIDEQNVIFLKDIYDHTFQVLDTINSYRDILSGMHDTYLSSISNRMNEVMKMLTIFASIFIPLTFLAGVYGMNFEYMPELSWKWSYSVFWGISLMLVGVLLIYFNKKDWL